MRRLHARHLLVPCGRRHRHGVLHRAAVGLLALPPHLWLRLRLPPPSPPNLSRVPTLALPQRMCRRVLQAARSQLVRGGSVRLCGMVATSRRAEVVQRQRATVRLGSLILVGLWSLLVLPHVVG